MSKLAYIYLFITIVAEVVAVGALKETKEFTRLIPSLIVIGGYAVTLYFLALVMRTVPVSLAYSFWAAFGILFVVLIGVFYYKETFDAAAMVGTACIVTGIVVINVFSKAIH